MSPLLVRTSFRVDQEDIPNGVTMREYARVRHALKCKPKRTVEQVADAACVTIDVALLCLAGRGATIEEA